jgi:hypothetical protein
MNKKPSSDECRLVGGWIEANGALVADSECARIQWLTDSCFELIAVDGANWSALYKDPDDGSYWELVYLQSHMHGAGPPMLKRVSCDYALSRYNIDFG